MWVAVWRCGHWIWWILHLFHQLAYQDVVEEEPYVMKDNTLSRAYTLWTGPVRYITSMVAVNQKLYTDRTSQLGAPISIILFLFVFLLVAERNEIIKKKCEKKGNLIILKIYLDNIIWLK